MSGPTLVYDDACGFCTWWADLFANHAEYRVRGFTEITPEERERLPPDYEECAHFLTEDDVYSCGAAVEEAIRRSAFVPIELPTTGIGDFGPYVRFRETGYRWVADHRGLLGAVISKQPSAEHHED